VVSGRCGIKEKKIQFGRTGSYGCIFFARNTPLPHANKKTDGHIMGNRRGLIYSHEDEAS